jgi:hypothetical protein
MIILAKPTLAAAVGLVLLATGAATTATAQTGGNELTPSQIAAKTRAAYAALSSYSDSGNVVFEMAGQKMASTFNTRLARPNLYRIECLQGTGLKGVVWSDGTGDYLQLDPGSPATPAALAAIAATGVKSDANPQKMQTMKAALAHAAGFSYSAATTIPAAFFDQNCGDVFVYPAVSGRYPLQKEQDGTIGGVDCYVVSTVMDLSKTPEAGKPGTVFTTLWIGKSDFLIHQSRTRYVEKVDESATSSDQAIDEAIKKSLAMQNKPVTPEAVAAMRPQMRAIMKQVQSTLQAGFKAGVVSTQTHENISVNQNLSPSDFTR